VNKLNEKAYLGITTWSLPITVYDDASCTLTSPNGGNFGYDCGQALAGNSGYPYSELGNLFYNVMGGTAHNNIKLVHGPKYDLFRNVQPYLYWSQTGQSDALKFSNDLWFQNGFQGTESEYDSMFVIPVSVQATTSPAGPMPACAVDPSACSSVVLPGLGVTTTVPPARPSLHPRGDGQLIYDPVTNVAYLANANLAATLTPDSPYYVKGINPDGSMNQAVLGDFLSALNNPEHPYLGLTGWNMPTTVAGGANPNCSIQVGTGEPDIGYNCDGKASDLGELFYDQFGISPGHTVNETWRWERWYFYNLVPDYYWQCDPAPGQPPSKCASDQSGGEVPSFSFLSGWQGVQSDPNDLFVMLVVPADEVPPAQRWWQ
jgi:hypothetical protein